MKKLGSILTLTFALAALFALVPNLAAAQDDQQSDPPGRVARLNYVEGSVSYQVSGDQDWVQADPNRPLTTGDNLWVDQDSRGEVHIGSTAIRMGSQTGISFLTLDDRTVQLQLAEGTIEVHLRNLQPAEGFEIDTPNLALTLTRSGEYRVQTDPNGNSTVVVVREGEGQVTGGGDSWDLAPGQAYEFKGTDELSYDAYAVPGFDDFEDWCQSRDDRENQAVSAKYVSRDVDGYYDLDEYGDWQSTPDYGEIWVPRGVTAGWAPYHFGHWVYVAPWGWTWVEDEPWGFAPFHYGRWAYVNGYWGWVPGPVVVRPVYAPALVAFVGGGGFSLSVSFGGGFAGVAWFPLGPRDVYIPGFRCSQRYMQNINITNTRVVNITQVTNIYNNVIVNRNVTVVNNYTYARNAAAVTAVSRDTFVNARPVAAASVRVTAEQMQNVRPVDSRPIAPTRTSYVSSTAKVASAKPSVPLQNRPIVARLTPATSRNSHVYTNESNEFNHPNAPQQNQNQRFNNGNTQTQNTQRGSQPENTQGSNNGFRPFTPPNNQNQTRTSTNGNQQQAQQNQQNNNERQSMRYTPPPKARDDMYDVHPPLNQNQNQNQREAQPPKQQEQHNPPKNEKQSNQKEEKH
jgi:hypothetical protein